MEQTPSEPSQLKIRSLRVKAKRRKIRRRTKRILRQQLQRRARRRRDGVALLVLSRVRHYQLYLIRMQISLLLILIKRRKMQLSSISIYLSAEATCQTLTSAALTKGREIRSFRDLMLIDFGGQAGRGS